MKTGYPRQVAVHFPRRAVSHNYRFFIHKSIERLAELIVAKYGHTGERAMLFPSHAAATRCVSFVQSQVKGLEEPALRVIDLIPKPKTQDSQRGRFVSPRLSAVLFPQMHFGVAKAFWQHSGEGVSSRRAEFCHEALVKAELEVRTKSTEEQRMCKGPRRYRNSLSVEGVASKLAEEGGPIGMKGEVNGDSESFVEERFGRNLEVSFAADAKLAIRRRIAGSLTADVDVPEALEMAKDTERTRDVPGFSEDDVYLYPCGMNAIFNTHRSLIAARDFSKSIMYGFPYIDTLKILQKFGPGALFYGQGSVAELDDLEKRLQGGENYLALFCEFPGNPLLNSPDLQRIRVLADQYDFFVVVDETIGTFINVNVLPYADVVVSSLTKIFSGDCNVMGGR